RLAASGAVARLAADRAFLATLGIDAPSIEGYLFPDTYQLVRGMTTEEILTRMVQRLRAKAGPDLAARAQARGLTVHQLLTLASIIEREAVERDEMRTISAVFWNRLKINMPLQADPTVQYATGKERGILTRADLTPAPPRNRGVAKEGCPAPFLYRALRGPVRRALARWFDLSIEGFEHLPPSGPYLIAANHHNYLDGIVLGVTVPEPISFLVMPRGWRGTPLHPMFHRNIRSIPIDLERADVGALRRALR